MTLTTRLTEAMRQMTERTRGFCECDSKRIAHTYQKRGGLYAGPYEKLCPDCHGRRA